MEAYFVGSPDVLLTSIGLLETCWLHLKRWIWGWVELDGKNMGVGLNCTIPQGSNLFLSFHISVCLIGVNISAGEYCIGHQKFDFGGCNWMEKIWGGGAPLLV